MVRCLLTILLGALGLFQCAAPAWALDPNVALVQLKHNRWIAEDGVPPGIYALAQTPDGFLWIGSDAGLHRFDGVRFELEPVSAGATGNEPVSALMVARNGDLWIGYQSGRAAVLRGHTLVDRSPPSSDRWIFRFVEDRTGAIWAMTGNTRHPLMRFSGDRWEHIGADWGFEANYAWSMAEAADGSLWLGDRKRTLALPPGQRRFRDAGIATVDAQGDNFGLGTDRAGRIWRSSAFSGTRRLPQAPGAESDHPNAPAVPVASAAHSYRTFLFDRDGALWGVTYSAGIYRIAQPQSLYAGGHPVEESFTAKEGLSSDRAQAILEDREGNIWVGTSAGLDRFRPANIRPATNVPSHSPFGYVLMAARDGTVYIADSDSLFRIAPGGAATRLLDGLKNPQALCEDEKGIVWLKTGDALFSGKQGRFERMPTPDKRRAALDCVATPDGKLWFSRVSGGLMRYEQGAWIESLADGPDGPLKIPALIAAPGGGLLAYMRSQGLMHLTSSTPRMLWPNADIPGGEVMVLYPVGKDVIVASLGGVARLREGKISLLRRQDAWLQGITGIVESQDGHLWLQSRAGIVRVPLEAFMRSFDNPLRPLEVEVMNFDDGLRAPPAPGYARNSAARGGDGRLWFLTTDGVAEIVPTRLARNPVPPPVKIVGLVYGGRKIRDPGAASLPAGASRIEIDYTALSLAVPRRVRFRYRLEGVDDGWIDAGNRRQAIYTNLGPGNYRFHVIAANNDGVWNKEGATLAIKVPPTFVQSFWFKALMVGALALALWGLYALRLRYETARLRDRFDAQLAERNRIARDLHDTLLQGMQGTLLSFQALASKLPPDAVLRQQMERVLDRTQEAIREGRDRIHLLRDPAASTMDLSDYLRQYAQEMATDHQLLCDFSVPHPPRPLNFLAYEELRQIGREAITNACLHSKGTRLDILLEYGNTAVVLMVQDDGQGIAKDQISTERHWGMSGMHERASMIGARLSVTRRPGGGTEVRLSVRADRAYPAPGS